MNRILSVNNSESEDRSIVLEFHFQGTICFISIFLKIKLLDFNWIQIVDVQYKMLGNKLVIRTPVKA